MVSNGPEVVWEVVHTSCPVRSEPHFDARVLSWKRRGQQVISSEMTTDGWLKISDGRGWMLSDLQMKGIGALLQPRRGQDILLAIEEPQTQGICCMEVTFAQVAVRASPSRDAIALCYRRKGELVFARSLNFSGWLKLAGEEGWMLAFAPEHGTLLQPREEDPQVDLWAVADLWTAVRRKKRMLTPADSKSLKDAEEGTKLMASMDYEHHVSTGNAEPLVEDGLLKKEDLGRPEEWVRQRLFAHSLVRMAKEEPPFCDVCPPDFRLTPRPLPKELFESMVLAEVQGEPGAPTSSSSSTARKPQQPPPPQERFKERQLPREPLPRAGGHHIGGAGRNGRDFSLGGTSKPSKGKARGGSKGGYGKGSLGGFGKGGMGGFGKGGFGMDLGMGGMGMETGVVPVEINGEEFLMTQEGLVFDPDTQAPIGLFNPQTGEVHEITEEHVKNLMENIGQVGMVELNGRPYILMAGLLVDPQTQAVAFKVEPDGTVVDAQTGEPCGMLDLNDLSGEPQLVPSSKQPNQPSRASQPFTDENLDAHGWAERARELAADDYFYQAAAAFGEALKCCEDERAVELDFECELLKGRAFCWRLLIWAQEDEEKGNDAMTMRFGTVRNLTAGSGEAASQARKSKGGDYVLLTVQDENHQPSNQGYLHIYSGCSETCEDCYSGTGQVLHPVWLPSMCGTTNDQSVFGLLYNPGDGSADTTFNCVESLDQYWEHASSNDLFATIMRISISCLIVLVVITLGSFIYLRICKAEPSSYGDGFGSYRGHARVRGADITREQVEACLPEVHVDEEATCAVCLDTIQPRDSARRLKCQHEFHSDCIISWCTHRAQRVLECPVCRSKTPLPGQADDEHQEATPQVIGGWRDWGQKNECDGARCRAWQRV
ncbi:unnamed protein product [Effrenium voratum]|uniref:RING-type domain-containing protein n=1 Tax=Effrenium voratum TaxID=2562239 RepID=A0AA36IXK1_9DINO|nr:unnamed protein product [Effrenium voratum]